MDSKAGLPKFIVNILLALKMNILNVHNGGR